MSRRFVTAALGIVALAAIVLFVRPSGPSVDGKPITYWLREMDGDVGDEARNAVAKVAIKRIGTNALPWLVRELQQTDSKLKLKVLKLVANREPFDKWLLSANDHQWRARQVFMLLGETASPAIPNLIQLLTNTNAADSASEALLDIGIASIGPLTTALNDTNAYLRCQAAHTLGGFGTNGASAISALLDLLHDPTPAVRCATASALGGIHSEPSRVVTELMQCLRDSAIEVRGSAAYALSRFGADAAPAVEPLLKLLDDPVVNLQALTALRDIGQRAELVVPVVLKRLEMGNLSRVALFTCLGSFPTEADIIIPALLKAADDSNSNVQYAVVGSLGRLRSKPEGTLPFLIERLKSPDAKMRSEAADAIGQFGSQAASAVPALTPLLSDKAMVSIGCFGSQVSDSARVALESIQGRR